MTTEEAAAIIALADNDLRIEPTARKLFMHRTTLVRLIRKIKKDTGLDPLNFYNMVWLVARAKQVVGRYGVFYDGGLNND